jgi:imidazolonepropionase-like amidohydrolase
MTLMPELIDAHVHICFNGDPTPLTALNYPPRLIQLFGAFNAMNTLEAGFTIVRDMGSPMGFAFALKKGIEM